MPFPSEFRVRWIENKPPRTQAAHGQLPIARWSVICRSDSRRQRTIVPFPLRVTLRLRKPRMRGVGKRGRLAVSSRKRAIPMSGPLRCARRMLDVARRHAARQRACMENPFDAHAQDPTGNALRRLLPVLGASITALLSEAAVSDVYLNPDGSIWIETPREGRQHTSLRLLPSEASQVVQGMARLSGTQVHSGAPILSVELIALQARFLGVVPPLVRAASFSIHKFTRPSRSLSEYVTDGTLTVTQRIALERSITARHTVLISGGPRTGKTTFAGALLSVMSQLPDRVLVLERAARLRSTVSHHISLRAAAPDISLQALLRIGMKWRPDRIVVDEIEGPELPELLRAWQGTHAGGFAATAAGSPRSALMRLEEILRQAGEVAPRACVARAVQVVVHLSGRGDARRMTAVMVLASADRRGYGLRPISPASP